MAEKLPTRITTTLVLQQRVPETHSASKAAHQWHAATYVLAVDATDRPAAEVLEHADVLLASARERSDYVYRVVLVSTETTGWVLA